MSDSRQLRDIELRLERVEQMLQEVLHVAIEGVTWNHPARSRAVDQITQHLARLEWQRRAAAGGPMPSFDDVEFRAFSQNGEDGILWYLFSLIGDGTKRVVEICSGDSIQCCAANLIVNHGWQGLLFEGDPERVAAGRMFYEHSRDAWYAPPEIVEGWVTAETVEKQLRDHDFDHDVDLLVIDIDGNDYWIWEALDIDPRVVVIEFNPALGPEASVVMPYDPSWAWQPGMVCRSASLRALTELATVRNYRLVGVQRYNFNAFFVRADCCPDTLPSVAVEDCFVHHTAVRAQGRSMAALLSQFDWVSNPAARNGRPTAGD